MAETSIVGRKIPCELCNLPSPELQQSDLEIEITSSSDFKHKSCLKAWLKSITNVNLVFKIVVTQFLKKGYWHWLPPGHKGDTFWVTPLMFAALHDFPDMVESLIDHGAEVNKMLENVTALYYATLHNDKESVDMLLQSGATQLLAKDMPYKESELLHRAALCGFEETIKHSIEGGANVEHRDYEKRTPLLIAVVNDRIGCVKVLLDKGANPNAEQGIFLPALHMAKSADCINLLLQAGADVNRLDKRNQTSALHLAKNRPCAEALLNAGAILDAENIYGETPLSYALRQSSYDMVEFFLEKGATATPEDFIYTAEYQFPKFLKLLIKYRKGNCMNVGIPGKGTALHCAACNCQKHNVKLLLQANANVNTHLQYYAGSLMSHRSVLNSIKDIMYAAGERIYDRKTEFARKKRSLYIKGQRCIQNPEELRHFCRETIRDHLLKINNTENLFQRIPKLGLPFMLCGYLLYNMSLEDSNQDI